MGYIEAYVALDERVVGISQMLARTQSIATSIRRCVPPGSLLIPYLSTLGPIECVAWGNSYDIPRS